MMMVSSDPRALPAEERTTALRLHRAGRVEGRPHHLSRDGLVADDDLDAAPGLRRGGREVGHPDPLPRRRAEDAARDLADDLVPHPHRVAVAREAAREEAET